VQKAPKPSVQCGPPLTDAIVHRYIKRISELPKRHYRNLLPPGLDLGPGDTVNAKHCAKTRRRWLGIEELSFGAVALRRIRFGQAQFHRSAPDYRRSFFVATCDDPLTIKRPSRSNELPP
jgi:hypothetical protein